MTDKTPIIINDLSRIEQARKERDLAAYHRRLADRSEKIATILEADAAEDSMSAQPPGEPIIGGEAGGALSGPIPKSIRPIKDAA